MTLRHGTHRMMDRTSGAEMESGHFARIWRLAGLAAVLWAAGAAPPAAVAEEYSWQVTGRYQDADLASNVESSQTLLRATYYLSAVDDGAGPYELAAFLNRSSYVAVGTQRSKQRTQLFPALTGSTIAFDGMLPEDALGVVGLPAVIPGWGALPTESGVDSSEFAVDGRYVWRGSGWYAGAQARRGDADMLPDLFFAQSSVDRESAGILAGKYFGTHTTLELSLESDTVNQELRTSPLVIDPSFGTSVQPARPALPVTPVVVSFDRRSGTDTETESARLSVRHVGELGGSTFSLSASVRSSRSDMRLIVPLPTDVFTPVQPFEPPDRGWVTTAPPYAPIEFFDSHRERQVGLSGALFPTRALGVRLSFSNADHDTFGSSDMVGLSANWFFVRNAAVAVELTREDAAGRSRVDLPDSDSVGVRLLGRF